MSPHLGGCITLGLIRWSHQNDYCYNLMITLIHYISTPNLEHDCNYTQVKIASEIFEVRKD